MLQSNETARAIGEMIAVFWPHCSDRSTMSELRDMVRDDKLWREAHKLFRSIRQKTLRADESKNHLLQCQYCFEEICAKTFYNMADHSEGFSSEYLPPFDDDVLLWVVPIAAEYAQALGLDGLRFGGVRVRVEAEPG